MGWRHETKAAPRPTTSRQTPGEDLPSSFLEAGGGLDDAEMPVT